MDQYKDLTLYRRFHHENARNIGFNVERGINRPVVSDEKSEQLVDKLIRFVDHPFNVIRGESFRSVQWKGKKYALGFFELRVIATDGVVYAAPGTVIADILEGFYIPPKEFIDAVLNGWDPSSNDYAQFEQRYKEEYFWGSSDDYLQKMNEALELILKGEEWNVRERIVADPKVLKIVTPEGTLLSAALVAKRENVAEALVDLGISLDLLEGEELLRAVESGSGMMVRKLIDSGIAIKWDLPRNNPLFLAVAKGQNEIAEWLYSYHREMVAVYQTRNTKDCTILKWTNMFQNNAFMEFLKHPYRE